MSYQAVKNEIDIDPLGRGYTSMSDEEVADSMNNIEDRQRNRESMTGSEVLNAVVQGEYSSLQVAKKDALWGLLGIGDLNPFGVEADIMIDIFGLTSATITELQAARVEIVSRGIELGLGIVRESDVIKARAL